MQNTKNDILLAVRNLKTYFYASRGTVKAVDGISFDIPEGRILGLVGESGCGKTMTALSIMGLVMPPGKTIEGEVIFKGVNLRGLPKEDLRCIRGSKISMIFQEPFSSLNPLFTIGEQIEEAMLAHRRMDRNDARGLAIELLRKVEIRDAERISRDYPHTLSGGMRQRAMLAMALANGPELLIADEPTTALDVTIQKEILELLIKLKEESEMSMLFITHNFGILAKIADDIGVMYLGKIVEFSDVRTLLGNPLHPYTKALLESIPRMGAVRLKAIGGSVPENVETQDVCPFMSRCDKKTDVCRDRMPAYEEREPGHFVACWYPER